MPHGLGMGGDLEKFRLFLPESLEGCSARNNCLTFETGSFFHDYRKAASPPPPPPASSTASSFESTPAPGLGPDFDIGEMMKTAACLVLFLFFIYVYICFVVFRGRVL